MQRPTRARLSARTTATVAYLLCRDLVVSQASPWYLCGYPEFPSRFITALCEKSPVDGGPVRDGELSHSDAEQRETNKLQTMTRDKDVDKDKTEAETDNERAIDV